MRLKMTEHARKLIQPPGESRLCRSGTISGGQLLSAMLSDSRGNVAMAALMEASFRDGVVQPLEKIISALAAAPGGEIDVRALVDQAIRQAESIGHSYAGPEHLLLALLEDQFSREISECFSAAHVTRSRVRHEVFAILGEDDPIRSEGG